jgi:2-dehydropantoate 2-reductase
MVSQVYAVCRKRHAEAIAKRGFVLTGLWGQKVYHFDAGEEIPDEKEYNYVLITSKAVDTEGICNQFADLLREKEVASLQNGIGNEEIISRYTNRVIGGTIITGFEWQENGAVKVTVEAGPAKLGRFPVGMDPAVEILVELMNAAGIETEKSPKIQSDLWAKTLYNCALNPLGAIMEVPYGALIQPDGWKIIEQVVQEVYEVLDADGISLPWPDAEAYLDYLGTYQLPATARHHSSMLQDLRAGRKTEIDFINGAVVSRALTHGMQARANEVLTRLVHFKESLRSGGVIP